MSEEELCSQCQSSTREDRSNLCSGCIRRFERKCVLNDIRTDLAKAISDDVSVVMGPHSRTYYLREAVSKLTQLVEDLHDLA